MSVVRFGERRAPLQHKPPTDLAARKELLWGAWLQELAKGTKP